MTVLSANLSSANEIGLSYLVELDTEDYSQGPKTLGGTTSMVTSTLLGCATAGFDVPSTRKSCPDQLPVTECRSFSPTSGKGHHPDPCMKGDERSLDVGVA